MKREKLFYIGAMAVLAVVLVLTMWYKRPLNIWEVTGVAEPEEISISITFVDGTADMEQRELTLSAGDEGFDALLERLEEIQFRRPPTNLIRIALPFLSDWSTGEKELEEDDFTSLVISLHQPVPDGDRVRGYVEFFVDQWSYRDFDRDVTLDLAVTDSKETGQALCAELWEKAQPVQSDPE